MRNWCELLSGLPKPHSSGLPKRQKGIIRWHASPAGEAMKTLTERRHEVRRFRPKGMVVVLLLGAIVQAAGAAQGRKKQKQGSPADLPGHVSYLASQLYGLHLDDSEGITNQIQSLVVGHLEKWVANRTPGDVEVRKEIEHAFSKLHYPAVASAAVFEASWKGEELIGAGYTLGWSDIWRRNVVVLLASRDGHTQKVALTTFVPRADLHYAVLPPSTPGDFRFLIYGSRLGKSHPRLTAALYSFDGQKLRSSWETHDLFGGKLSVQGNQLVITYLKEDEFIRDTAQGHYPPRYQVTYTITPKGIELAGEKQIPFE
jgi:hypothetical protein